MSIVTGKVALVTGAAQGIGKARAELFAKEGGLNRHNATKWKK